MNDTALIVQVGDLIQTKNDKSKQLQSSDYQSNGILPIVDQGSKPICGYTNDLSKRYDKGLPVVIFGDHTLHTKFIDFHFAIGADGTQVLAPKSEDCDTKYLYYLISRATELIGSEGYKRHFKILKEFDIEYIKPLPEQQKIAAILSSVDEVIEKTRAQIDKLKDLKIGMMQELLTKGIGHTEFKDSPVGRIPAGWEVSSLNQLVTIKHGYAFEGAYFRSVPTPYLLLTPGNFNKDGRLYFGPKTKYYDGPVPEDFILKNGDVLVVMTDLTNEMTILGNTIILKSPNTVLHNQRIGKVVSLKENILLPNYLCMIMNSDRVKSHIKDTATGTTVRHTSPTKILEPLIPIPPISEQAKIADIFRALNDKVALVKSKLAAHEIIKKALMQDLLTGKVRVQVDARELTNA